MMFFNDPDSPSPRRQELSTGTESIRKIRGRYFLITARHNLIGRHPDTSDPISRTGAIGAWLPTRRPRRKRFRLLQRLICSDQRGYAASCSRGHPALLFDFLAELK